MSRFALLCVCLILCACASEKKPQALHPVVQNIEGLKTHTIMVATARQQAEVPDFSDLRAKMLSFQNVVVSVPPTHKAGEIEWPSAFPGSAAEHFVTLDNRIVEQRIFLRTIEAQLPPTGDVLVFIHGYNTHHEEAVFRLAQMTHDGQMRPVPVAFTWASRGAITDYVTDRESSLAARSRLYELLVLLSQSPKIKRINLFSHSMGAMLTTETLVQAKLRGNGDFGGKLDAVVLASPDIDVDVFLSQFEIIGKRSRPTVILTARDDRALQLARRLAGNVVRIGAASLRDPASVTAIKTYGFTVIDMTELKTDDSTNHTKFANSPAFLKTMGHLLNAGLQRSESQIGGFIVNATGAVLEAPSTVFRKLVQH